MTNDKDSAMLADGRAYAALHTIDTALKETT